MQDLSESERARLREAMAKEWYVFNMFGATGYLSQEALDHLKRGKGKIRKIDRWVLTYKPDGAAKGSPCGNWLPGSTPQPAP